MALTAASKKRKVQDGMAGRIQPKKKFRKQTEYHSSTEDEDESDNDASTFAPVNLLDSDEEQAEKVTKSKANKEKLSLSAPPKKSNKKKEIVEEDDALEDDEPDVNASSGDEEEDNEDNDSTADDDDEEGGLRLKTVTKRHDPTAFSTSISKILSTKLPTSARADPVLSRSKAAAQASSELANERLEQRARSKLRAEKKEEQERGRVRDVLGIERGEAGETAEEEKRLRKIAQRGVVKLFNAVRAAQVRGEEAARAEQKKGTIGIEERKKAANEVSKQSFLELINGKKGKALNIEEA
ncbi:Ribosomal RNA-processing protein 15 [Talaromyces pinophilus]|nr:Ribosomal RNA-processing protein 15 [Talaromyces pinophilus]